MMKLDHYLPPYTKINKKLGLGITHVPKSFIAPPLTLSQEDPSAYASRFSPGASNHTRENTLPSLLPKGKQRTSVLHLQSPHTVIRWTYIWKTYKSKIG